MFIQPLLVIRVARVLRHERIKDAYIITLINWVKNGYRPVSCTHGGVWTRVTPLNCETSKSNHSDLATGQWGCTHGGVWTRVAPLDCETSKSNHSDLATGQWGCTHGGVWTRVTPLNCETSKSNHSDLATGQWGCTHGGVWTRVTPLNCETSKSIHSDLAIGQWGCTHGGVWTRVAPLDCETSKSNHSDLLPQTFLRKFRSQLLPSSTLSQTSRCRYLHTHPPPPHVSSKLIAFILTDYHKYLPPPSKCPPN